MPDGKSVFKVYYISVIGRDRPELYEWQRSPRTTADFERMFVAGGHEGVGFVLQATHCRERRRECVKPSLDLDKVLCHVVSDRRHHIERSTRLHDGLDLVSWYLFSRQPHGASSLLLSFEGRD